MVGGDDGGSGRYRKTDIEGPRVDIWIIPLAGRWVMVGDGGGAKLEGEEPPA